jgi:mxaC protein
VLLVSDGGSKLDPDVRTRLAAALQRARVSVYWLYIRSVNSASIRDSAQTELSETVPEIALHRFLEGTGVPYQAFEAEDPQALRHAIDEIDRMEKHTIVATAIVPRRELASWLYGAAALCTALLAMARLVQRTRWAPA